MSPVCAENKCWTKEINGTIETDMVKEIQSSKEINGVDAINRINKIN